MGKCKKFVESSAHNEYLADLTRKQECYQQTTRKKKTQFYDRSRYKKKAKKKKKKKKKKKQKTKQTDM